MKFPKKLTVTLKSSANGALVPNRAIHLTIRVPRKNNYNIGVRLTNELGQAEYTEEEIKDEIEWTRREYIMDYTSTYDECFSDFSIVLFSKDGVQNCLKHVTIYKKFGGYFAKNFDLIQQAHNSNSAKQQWEFDSEKLATKDGVAHIECLVDGI